MHRNHSNRDGFFVDSKLTAAAAKTMHNDPGFSASISGNAYATPLFLDNAVVPALNSGKAALLVATETNDVYALDATTGAQVWHSNVGAPGSPACGDPGNINPQGVTGTPAIDLASSTIVMAAAQGPGNTQDHVVYALDLATGTPKWHVSLSGVKDGKGNTFDPTQHLQRPAALIANGQAYFGFGGNIGDCGTYDGWIISVPLDGNASNVKGWRPDDSKSGIWAPGGPSSDQNSIYVTTGNGSGPASWAGSEGVIRLGFDLSFTSSAMDYYAPGNYPQLDSSDTDISGSGPLLIDTPAGKPLILALGKDGNAYLIDRTNLGGVGANLLDQQQVSNGAISNAAAWANVGGATYVVANNSWTAGSGCSKDSSGDLFAIKIDANSKMTEIWCGTSGGHTSPIITTSDGSSDAIVWVGGGSNGAPQSVGSGDGNLHAFDLLTGNEITNTASIPGMAVLSSSLIAANGRIYAASNMGQVYAVTP
jgi:outer membrane protein assembly factor BamB